MFVSQSMLPWSERHRPTRLVDVGGNDDVVRVLRSFTTIASVPHLILHGPPGSGKTSSILAMGRSFFGDTNVSSMLLELNAGDVRGVETMRKQIQYFTRCSFVTETANDGIKMIGLDEADSHTSHAQCALRHLIETSSGIVRFCLCCNYVSKLSAGLRSRCTSFRFSGLGDAQLYRTVQAIDEKEDVELSGQGLDAVVDVCSGDAGQAINLLQSLSLGTGRVKSVYASCGLPSPSQIDMIFWTLFNQQFFVAHESPTILVHDIQFSLAQILLPLVDKIVASSHASVCPARVGSILSVLADAEHCLLQGGSESIAIGAVVGAFHSSIL